MRINSGMVILRTIQPSQFFLTLFTSNFMKRFLNKVTVQSAQPHLTVATIKMMKFFIPKSIEEQEKLELSLANSTTRLSWKRKSWNY